MSNFGNAKDLGSTTFNETRYITTIGGSRIAQGGGNGTMDSFEMNGKPHNITVHVTSSVENDSGKV